MSIVSKLALLVITSLVASACHKDPLWCPDQPGNTCRDAGSDTGCTSNDQCATPTPVCDVSGSKTCVQCVAPDQVSACTGATPACGTDRTCRACKAHSECPMSGACLTDGSCANESNVAYVDPTGSDNNACTKATPCTKVAKALATSRPFVKFTGTTNELVVINNQNVALLADPGAKLTNTSIGVLLQVTGTSTVEIDDLEFSGGLGTTSPAISVPAGQTVSLTIRRAIIAGNQGGGISVSGSRFDITNTFIHHNGNSTLATIGGASIAPGGAGTSRFEFNTVVDNQIANSVANSGGVFCDTSGFTAPNNIIARNFVNNDATKANSNTSGLCTYPTSNIAMNVNALAFVSPDNQPYNYHLTSASSAIDQATTASTVTVDIDRDLRPQGAASDQGADEYK